MADQAFRAGRALGYRQFTAGQVDSATLLTAVSGGLPAGTTTVVFKPQAQAIRYRDDGTSPTATIGYPIPLGQEVVYTSANLPQLSFIASTAGAIIDILCYG